MSIWIPEGGNKVRCQICFRSCLISEDQTGFCGVRSNKNGALKLQVMDRPSAVAVDPIEKKPLHHFHSGRSILSLGARGCNLHCQFCQNWHLSRSRSLEGKIVSEADVINAAKENDCIGLAYTYNEPIVLYEYVIKMARLARSESLKNVVVSAGHISAKARKDFFENIDAANIDLKFFDESFYNKYCNGKLSVVLDTLQYLRQETNIWLELTNLIIPGLNDNPEMIEAMCQWIVSKLGSETPLHFSAFYPQYEMLDRESTTVEILEKAQKIAVKSGLKHIYLGNVGHSNDVRCSECEAKALNGFCSKCGKKIAGHWPA